MNEYVAAIILVVLIYAVLCVPVGMLNTRLFKAIRGEKATGINLGEAYAPFTNITYSRKLLFGKTAYTYGLYVVGALLAFRAAAVLLVTKLPILTPYSAFTTLLAIAIYIVLYVANAASICRLLRGGAALMLVSIFIAPVGYYLSSARVPRYFRSVEDEVSGRFKSAN